MSTSVLLILLLAFTHFADPTHVVSSSSQTSEGLLAPAPRFAINRGVNISHWLSQSERRGSERREWFTRKDVAYLAGIGYDHLRIPVDEEQLWDEDGYRKAEAFELLHQAIGWCREHKLRAIVDLHILRSHHFNEKEKLLWTQPAAQERFLQCWRELSHELRKYPNDWVAYELMNEPVADNAEEWNQLVAKTLDVLRETEPKRFVVVGSNRWQSTETFDQLRVPAKDRYLILSFHFYEPFLLTHHQASWTDIAGYKGPVNYPGQLIPDEALTSLSGDLASRMKRSNRVFTADSLAARMAKPIRVAQQLGLPLYCGEWGCLSTVPEADRLRWYADVRGILEKNKIAWANWDYKGSFGIVDKDRQPYESLVKVLLK